MHKWEGMIFDQEYESFCQEMVERAENANLPAMFQLNNVYDLSCQDIGELCEKFELDTGLEMTAHLFSCHDCGNVHIMFGIDYHDSSTEHLQ